MIMYKIRVDPDLCKGCGICIEFCPKKVYKFSEKYSKKGVKNPVAERIDECIGCQLCELMCPDMAIEVSEDEG